MDSLKRILYGWVEKKFLTGCSNFNNLTTRKLCRSKRLARELFAANGIPHAQGEVFFNPFTALSFVNKSNFPLVIKPNVGGFSRGSHFPITSHAQLLKAAFQVKVWWPSSVIEQYLEGANYRVLVSKDQILSVIRRYPPQVTGNGNDTIEDLIDRENEMREQLQLYPIMSPISKGRKTQRYLARSGKVLKTVPEEGDVVQLHNRIALASGGIVETVKKEVIPQENLLLFQKVPGLLGANLLGIDAIFEKGIETSYHEQKVIFLEINSRPYVKMHDYPRYGKKDNLQPHLDKLADLSISDKDTF